MTCEIVMNGNVLFVLMGQPHYSDIPVLLHAADAIFAETGKPFVLVVRVPADTPPPDRALQAAFNQRTARLLEHCTAFHTLMEGTGFFNVAKRSVLSAIFIASGRRKTFFIHSSAEEMRRSRARDPSLPAIEAGLLAAGNRGLLTRSLVVGTIAQLRP